jgi:two-component system, chemotaxis family, protein-glutamate methylesterase/glutaminase
VVQEPVEIVVVAASAGGIGALTSVLSALPADFPAPIVVVQHLSRDHPSMLAGILDRRSPLTVQEAQDGETLRAGTVYIAPPDHHVLVTSDGALSLSQTELVHFVRPSADVLFESAAASYGLGVVAVVLSGAGVDGAAGVEEVKRRGGVIIAQDEATSASFGMPSAAIRTDTVDDIVPLDEIGRVLRAYAGEPRGG